VPLEWAILYGALRMQVRLLVLRLVKRRPLAREDQRVRAHHDPSALHSPVAGA